MEFVEGFGEEFIWLILVGLVAVLFSFLYHRNSARSQSNNNTTQQEESTTTSNIENENPRESEK